jgi:hypothetical protein
MSYTEQRKYQDMIRCLNHAGVHMFTLISGRQPALPASQVSNTPALMKIHEAKRACEDWARCSGIDPTTQRPAINPNGGNR